MGMEVREGGFSSNDPQDTTVEDSVGSVVAECSSFLLLSAP